MPNPILLVNQPPPKTIPVNELAYTISNFRNPIETHRARQRYQFIYLMSQHFSSTILAVRGFLRGRSLPLREISGWGRATLSHQPYVESPFCAQRTRKHYGKFIRVITLNFIVIYGNKRRHRRRAETTKAI